MLHVFCYFYTSVNPLPPRDRLLSTRNTFWLKKVIKIVPIEIRTPELLVWKSITGRLGKKLKVFRVTNSLVYMIQKTVSRYLLWPSSYYADKGGFPYKKAT
jgi:hypothetical protein